MKTADYLQILRNEIHTTVMATVDGKGYPITRVIDVMLVDSNTLYFLTAKGKAFYEQLMQQQYVSLSGACGGEGMDKKEASIHMKAISVRGKIKNIGTEKLEEIFEKNPYMAEIYPTEISRQALEVFCVCEGEGEFFDLSTKPITRDTFKVGVYEKKDSEEKENKNQLGYVITGACIGCGTCVGVCPQQCIKTEKIPFEISKEHCLHCGNCMNVCPINAVVRLR